MAARLLIGVLAVSGLGLALSLVAGTVLLRDYLYGRVAEQVSGLSQAPDVRPGAIAPSRLCEVTDAPAVLPSDFRLTVIEADGSVRCRVPGDQTGPPVPSVDELRDWADDDAAAVVGDDSGSWATSVDAFDQPGRDGGEGYVMVAISLRNADLTVHRVAVGGAAIGVVVLAVLALAGRMVIRIGLRPLTGVREAAREIRHGDLSARVPPGKPGTEVADLSTALNSMLEEIQRGFEKRRESEQRIRQFATDASHELRTPLTSIKGYAQLYAQMAARNTGSDAGTSIAREARNDVEQRRAEVVSRIDSEADRMSGIVEDLLLLARLDQQPELVKERVDLVEIAHDVLTAARAGHPERRLDLKVEGPVEVEGDPGRLQQVVANLVTNAIAHTPSAIVVAAATTDGVAVLEVRDDGPGMPAEVQHRIFDRFYRADVGRSRRSGGSGLGLSIVRALVEAHGGSLECVSSVARGSTFTVTLPRAS
ncbi:sensor histidine kinase [Nocardioides renjunii]|uniref:sensor histidine kinase n=1 Tax=Nocardioides renjunii TaxID=3095075 RepID=UPI002AFEC962|nr:HAMP domain-containing sensor histidine kinase [Nocardioides sp. S-34]WQQ20458.1 HAMP domain-containing sensor histidine kinase [Nocardioides sp. S-34]